MAANPTRCAILGPFATTKPADARRAPPRNPPPSRLGIPLLTGAVILFAGYFTYRFLTHSDLSWSKLAERVAAATPASWRSGRLCSSRATAVGLALPAGGPARPGRRLGAVARLLRPHGLGRAQPHHAHGARHRRPDAGAVLRPRLPAALRPALRRRPLGPGGPPHRDEPLHLDRLHRHGVRVHWIGWGFLLLGSLLLSLALLALWIRAPAARRTRSSASSPAGPSATRGSWSACSLTGTRRWESSCACSRRRLQPQAIGSASSTSW